MIVKRGRARRKKGREETEPPASLAEVHGRRLLHVLHGIGMMVTDETCPRGLREHLHALYFEMQSVLHEAGLSELMGKSGRFTDDGVKHQWPRKNIERWKALG